MTATEETLDPDDWEALRRTAHRMVDDAIDYTATLRKRPVWQSMPADVRAGFKSRLPQTPTPLDDVYDELTTRMMPYPMGNIHPRFWMWFMGASNVTGALGDFLAAILGSNTGGGDHAAALMDRQVVEWLKEMLGFPADASGTLVSGGSVANLVCLTVARNQMAGTDLRELGVAALPAPLRFYGSDQIHSCHQKAIETLGLGNRALRRVPSHPDCTMDVAALQAALAEDRQNGWRPACVIATAGTINSGAIDDLSALAAVCRSEGVWMHVDGCIGALAALAPDGPPGGTGFDFLVAGLPVQAALVTLFQAQLADVFGALVVALVGFVPVFHGLLFGQVDAADVAQQVAARLAQRVVAEQPGLDLHARKTEALRGEARHFLVAQPGADGQ